jgi:hypothetical protein
MSADEELEALEAEMQARKDKHAAARSAQRLIDKRALNEAQLEHGEESVEFLNVKFTPGLTTLVIVKRPAEFTIKKFRHMVKAKPGRNGKTEPGDQIEAVEAVADVCVIYPTGDELDKLYAERPGVKAQAGAAALELITAAKESEGKE